jgi:hypothetical protein
VPVTVEDQFGTLQGNVRFPHRLCAAANKNGEGIGDPTEHLTAYVFKVPFTKQLNQTTVDQFRHAPARRRATRLPRCPRREPGAHPPPVTTTSPATR